MLTLSGTRTSLSSSLPNPTASRSVKYHVALISSTPGASSTGRITTTARGTLPRTHAVSVEPSKPQTNGSSVLFSSGEVGDGASKLAPVGYRKIPSLSSQRIITVSKPHVSSHNSSSFIPPSDTKNFAIQSRSSAGAPFPILINKSYDKTTKVPRSSFVSVGPSASSSFHLLGTGAIAGSITNPPLVRESGKIGTEAWQGLHSNKSRSGVWNNSQISTGRSYSGTVTGSSILVIQPLATATSGSVSAHNKTASLLQNATTWNSTTLPPKSPTIANSTSVGYIFGNSTRHNATFTNSTRSNSTLRFSNSQNLPSSLLNITSANFTFTGLDNSSANLTINLTSAEAQPKVQSNQTDQCLSTAFKNMLVKTTTFIATTLEVGETITIYGNASTPPPVFITPPPACHTIFSIPFPKIGKQPGGGQQTEASTTLLVTKKAPVVIRSPQTVGPIYNVPTTTPQTKPGPESIQPAADGKPATQPSKGLGSSGQSVPQSSDDDRSPGSAPLQQVYPEVAQSASQDSSQSSPAQADSGVPNGQSSVNGAPSSDGQGGTGSTQTTTETQYPEDDGQATSGGQGSGSASQNSSKGQASDDNSGQVSSGEQVSGDSGTASGSRTSSNGQVSGGGQNPPGVGQTPGGPQSAGGSSNQSPPSSEQDSSGSNQPASGQPASNGVTSNSPDVVSGNTGSGDESSGNAGSNGSVSGSQSETGGTIAGIGTSAGPDGISQGSAGGTRSYPNQFVPHTATINDVPISIAGSAIMVGSQTVAAGSVPTTVIANGRPVAVEPSQVIGLGTTIPIEAATPPPSVASAVIGGVPVILQPDNIIIGSQTFSHGSSAAFAVYSGQTYSWDARQLVGPGGTMVTFPTATSNTPCITAGGQVFSVYSSTLEASGTNISIPNTPEASPFILKGQTFSINPSQLIAPEKSITVPPTAVPTPFVYNGQTYSVDESRFIAPSATIPLTFGSGTVRYGTQVFTVDQTQVECPETTISLSNGAGVGDQATPSAITTGGLTFSLGPQAAVIGSSTYSFLPGQTPTTVADQGQSITLGSSGIQFGNVNIPIPSGSSTYSTVIQDGVTLSVAASAVVLNGQTNDIKPTMAPFYTDVNGQTISIGPQGIGFASTTVALPLPSPVYATITEGDLTFSIAPSEAVIQGSTFAIGPNMPATLVLNGQTVSVGPSQIYFPGTTVDLPTATAQDAPAVVTAEGLTISVGPTDAVIGGTSYPIGIGATAQTVMMGSETVKIGEDGIMLASTTIAPEQTLSAMTADGLTFSADNTEAIINGTGYVIGSEAIAKTIVVGSETIGLGTKGIILPSTTIAPWENTTQTSLSSNSGTVGTLRSTSHAAAAAVITAAAAPTGLPGTDTGGTKNDVHRGIGYPLKPPDTLSLLVSLGSFILGLLAM